MTKDTLDAGSTEEQWLREALLNLFRDLDPRNIDRVDDLIGKHPGKPDRLWRKLVKKFGEKVYDYKKAYDYNLASAESTTERAA